MEELKFAERLLDLLEETGVSQYELAKEIGVSKTAIYWYVLGERLPGAYNLYQLSRYFNVSADWLLGLSDKREVAK